MRRPSSSTVPGSATATVSPAPKFQAPHTIWRGSPSPTSTRVSCSRSAFGCLPASTHEPGDDQLLDAVHRRQAAPLDALDLVARERELRDELVQRRQLREVVGQPLQRNLHRTAPAELLEEAHVVVVEALDVRDAVLEHRDALDAHAERPAATRPRGRSRSRSRTRSGRPCPRRGSRSSPRPCRRGSPCRRTGSRRRRARRSAP